MLASGSFTSLEVVGSAEQFVGREAVEHAAGGGYLRSNKLTLVARQRTCQRYLIRAADSPCRLETEAPHHTLQSPGHGLQGLDSLNNTPLCRRVFLNNLRHQFHVHSHLLAGRTLFLQ